MLLFATLKFWLLIDILACFGTNLIPSERKTKTFGKDDVIFPLLCNTFLTPNLPTFRTCQVKWKTSDPDKYIFMHFLWNQMNTEMKGEK